MVVVVVVLVVPFARNKLHSLGMCVCACVRGICICICKTVRACVRPLCRTPVGIAPSPCLRACVHTHKHSRHGRSARHASEKKACVCSDIDGCRAAIYCRKGTQFARTRTNSGVAGNLFWIVHSLASVLSARAPDSYARVRVCVHMSVGGAVLSCVCSRTQASRARKWVRLVAAVAVAVTSPSFIIYIYIYMLYEHNAVHAHSYSY